MRVANVDDRAVHFALPDTRELVLQTQYACGVCWPRELWGNVRAPRDTYNRGHVTCEACLAALDKGAQ